MRDKSSPILRRLVQAFSKNYQRRLFFYLIVASMLWLWGRWDMSFAWILVIISIYLLGEYRSQGRKRKRRTFHQLSDESNFSKVGSFKLPPQHLTDKEKAAWINEIINRSWSSIEGLTRSILIEHMEPELQKRLPAALKSLRFDKIELGKIPPYIGNITSYGRQGNSRPSEYMMDVDLFYKGDAQVKFTVKNVKMGITDFQVHGTLRIILKPLFSFPPIIGGVTVFFLKRPNIAFNLTNMLNVLEIPGLNKTLRHIVDDVIAANVVLPNRIAIPLAGRVDVSDLQYPVPEGLLRVHLVEARELVASDASLIGSGSSDPYAVLEVGAQTFRTETKKNDLNPVWQETFEAFVDNSEGQELQISLYDNDVTSKDTILGKVNLNICSVVGGGALDIWMPLSKAKQGKVHLKVDWFSLSSHPLHFKYTKEPESVAVLIVKLIKVTNLPSRKKSALTRKVHCVVTVGKNSLSSACANGDEPTWNESLQFLLTDPHEEARVEVMEGDSSMGFVLFSARKLIELQDMTLQDTFPLQSTTAGNGNGSCVTCKFVLRALKAVGAPVASGFLKTDRKFQACDDNDHCPQRLDTPTMIPEVDGHGSSLSTENFSGGSTEKASTSGSGSVCNSSPSGSIIDEGSKGQDLDVSGLDYLSRGEVSLSLIYNHRRNRLMVTILNAKIISSSLPASKAKLYVQTNLLPSRSKKTVRKTFTFPGNLNPIFNESFDYVIGLDQLVDRELQVAVQNEKRVQLARKQRELIGSSSIKLCDLSLSAGVTLTCELNK
ncbi:extended synaptotagmin-3-like [Montipora foliosa]|uniref:extended synaptotagmin-3-like n=1 Tax=Montipora foliosa TaxID=591990 RepID=UPI0035F2179F